MVIGVGDESSDLLAKAWMKEFYEKETEYAKRVIGKFNKLKKKENTIMAQLYKVTKVYVPENGMPTVWEVAVVADSEERAKIKSGYLAPVPVKMLTMSLSSLRSVGR